MTLNPRARHIAIALRLGYQDVMQAYRRSSIGPFWITLGMAVQVVAIGLVFGLILGAKLSEFLPFLAVSLILWGFIVNVISDGSLAFVTGATILKELPIHYSVHVYRSMWKNTLALAHNLVIVPVVFLFFLRLPNLNIFLIIPGFILTTTFLLFSTFVLGLITTRYRDMQQIIASVMTVMFYVTPVIWQPSLIPSGTAHLLLGLNPFYHFLQILRLPILGQAPTFENWALSVAMTLVAGLVAYFATKKYKNKLAYWV